MIYQCKFCDATAWMPFEDGLCDSCWEKINNENNFMITIKNFKAKMIEKAKKQGSIWENFGQKELHNLKEKYNYNDLKYGNEKERLKAKMIDELDNWASHFDLSQLN